jgi:threonine dehydrogenase-like Zn-dependent dehydrogenase
MIKASGAAKLIAFETVEARRKLCTAMGADYVYDPVALTKQGTRPSDVVLDLTHGEGANFQLEAAGVPTLTFPEMERSMAVNGKIAQVGRAADRVPVYGPVPGRRAVLRVAGPFRRRDLPQRHPPDGRESTRKIITARFSLDNVVGDQAVGSRSDGRFW